MYTAAEAVGMWESRAFGGIPKCGGKRGKLRSLSFPRFPPRVISTAPEMPFGLTGALAIQETRLGKLRT
jgi:hypothetical protein